MAPALTTPGVYREESFARAPEALPTGVPGFVGFGVARDAQGAASAEPQELLHADQLAARWTPLAGSYLVPAVKGFFANGGRRCFVVGVGDPQGEVDGGMARLIAGITRLGPLADVDLMAVPDAMRLPDADAWRVQREEIAQCALQGSRMAILDAPRVPAEATEVATDLTTWRDGVLLGSADPGNAALYFPWVMPVEGGQAVPPCGHVAGIFSRSDSRQGFFKAPANEELVGVVDLDFQVDGQVHGELNSEGINCLRALPGRGLRVYGARTLSQESSWRYVNVRRVFHTVARWIDRNMAWAPFEANTGRLWNRIQRELGAYLAGLWRAGALKGQGPSDAYYVKCDGETNPQEVREQGQVVTEIGLAPASPAEFIVVHVTQRAGSTQFS